MSQLFVLYRMSHQKLRQNLVGNWIHTLWKLRLVPLVGYSMDLYKEFLSCLTEELLQRCRRNRVFLFFCMWDIGWWYEVMLIVRCIILQFAYSYRVACSKFLVWFDIFTALLIKQTVFFIFARQFCILVNLYCSHLHSVCGTSMSTIHANRKPRLQCCTKSILCGVEQLLISVLCCLM